MPGQAPPLTDERELLLAYIAQQRDGVRFAAYGLTEDQARLTPTAGALSIGGLIKHVADMERTWTAMISGRSSTGSQEDRAAAYADNFDLGPNETLADAIAAMDVA